MLVPRIVARADLRWCAGLLTRNQSSWSAASQLRKMRPQQIIARRLAEEFLGERLSEKSIIRRGELMLGPNQKWLATFAKRVSRHFGDRRRPLRIELERFILDDPGFQKAWRKGLRAQLGPDRETPAMCPAFGPPETWQVPPLRTKGELSQWLGIEPNELDWFADRRRQERTLPEGPLRNYIYRWICKRDGSARLIESPKRRLKAIQRRILKQIIDRIPPHSAAHGFRAGRSIKTSATPHTGQAVVLKMDLKDFFPGIFPARIVAIFMTAGYPEEVARTLAGLCASSVPRAVLALEESNSDPTKWKTVTQLYRQPHLPQGAPTSPALANLAAFRFDCRVAGLARKAVAQYTRYADDLVISGGAEFAKVVARIPVSVGTIAIEEGFEVNMRKTRIMRHSVAQRALGLVVNSHLNVSRASFDRLKAILHNCAKYGPGSQNRDELPSFHAHLAGRIAHVESINPGRGRKLRAIFESVDWTAADASIR